MESIQLRSRALANSPVTDVKIKVNFATECRDAIEILCSGQLYPVFLKKLVPVFMKLLEGPPVFISTSWEQVGHCMRTNRNIKPGRLTFYFRDCVTVLSRSSIACQ